MARIDALPHLDLRHHQCRLAGGVDADEGVGGEFALRRIGRLRRLIGRADRKLEGEHKAAGKGASEADCAVTGQKAVCGTGRNKHVIGQFMATTQVCRSEAALLDGFTNPDIGAAATDISGHGGIDVSIVGRRRRSEQRGRRHDLPGLAVAALNDFEIEPGLLHLGADRCGADAFDCGDGASAHRTDRQQTGAHGLAVDMHSACPA